MTRTLEHKRKKNLCTSAYCRNKPETGSRICSKCRKRLYKERHPERYTYTYVKNNARRRGKRWELTMDQFIDFLNDTGYMFGKGRQADKLSIDRIDHRKGYSVDNIQVLTVSANSIKGNMEKNCPF